MVTPRFDSPERHDLTERQTTNRKVGNMSKLWVFAVVSWSIVVAGIAALVIIVEHGDSSKRYLFILAATLCIVAMYLTTWWFLRSTLRATLDPLRCFIVLPFCWYVIRNSPAGHRPSHRALQQQLGSPELCTRRAH